MSLGEQTLIILNLSSHAPEELHLDLTMTENLWEMLHVWL